MSVYAPCCLLIALIFYSCAAVSSGGPAGNTAAGNSSTGPLSFSNGVIGHLCTDAGIIPGSVITQIRQKDIYFEHASVGDNIMQGMRDLMASNARYSNDYCGGVGASYFQAHKCFSDTNRSNPGVFNKIAIFFGNETNAGLAASLYIAMFKFCFIDNTGDPTNIFNSNRMVMERLEGMYTNVAYVWWTMPIQTGGDSIRDGYNALVRKYCASNRKLLIDIADIECHDPAGTYLTNGSGLETLCGAYTTDGGHLSNTCGLRVANAVWVALARASGWNP